MPTPKTIFDEVLEEFVRRLEADPDLGRGVAERLQHLFLARTFKIDVLRDAIINSEHQQ